jgi:hypothetical protein
MKIRLGFVSNSSSCSFTCPVCEVEQDVMSDSGEKTVTCINCFTKLIIKHLVLERLDGDD